MAEHAPTGAVEHVGAPEPHPEPTAFGLDAPQWIALAMLLVFAVLLWKRVPALIGRALDKKIASIREQLDEAAQLRREAEALRAEYEAKAAAADAERQTMLERARHEAEGIVEQAKADTAALIERRRRMAEEKIAAAERHAIDEVRARAATSAAAAAARLIAEEMKPDADRAMIDRTIEGLGRPH
ncbi:MAG: F0F1 ATP synthase subunit B [Alphaproteobacteria bacterium]|nr:F0F1 ATP synthase subunit B [Alphaproteobacteria bacterium]MBV9372813.1 F0F1 ATP synthase subunit B [Alphaproteobacteria bacterium]MBV9900492.1 F0F1 ATP synthase subunit B [Alphaproteobacteria bacterium]